MSMTDVSNATATVQTFTFILLATKFYFCYSFNKIVLEVQIETQKKNRRPQKYKPQKQDVLCSV